MPKIIHFRENCIGCNSCVEHCPLYWQIDGDGKSTLKKSKEKNGVYVRNIMDVEVAVNKLAADDCPVGIIRIVDEGGNEIH